MSVSFAFRLGFPIGANIAGHATAAPSGMLRVRYALGEDSTGLHLSGAIGAGIIRHTVALNDPNGEMNTDTTAAGPALASVGAGFVRPVGGPIKIVAETNLIAAIPVIGELGSCDETGTNPGCIKPSFALQLDFNLALMFAF